jgi:hypothetical protein
MTHRARGHQATISRGLPTRCQGVFLKPFHVVASVWIAGATDMVVYDDRRVS